MVENLEHLIRRAACDPRLSRTALFKELLRSETYLLTVDLPLEEGEVKRVTKPDASFPVWADKDAELGGVWVPVFPARDRVCDFVSARTLKTPRGKEFLAKTTNLGDFRESYRAPFISPKNRMMRSPAFLNRREMSSLENMRVKVLRKKAISWRVFFRHLGSSIRLFKG